MIAVTTTLTAVGLLVAVLILLPRLLDISSYREEFVVRASEALMMPVAVEALELRLLTGPQLRVRNVRLGPQGNELLLVPHLRLGLDINALLRRQIEIESITVLEPLLSLVRSADGSFNFIRPNLDSRSDLEFDLSRIVIRDGVIEFRQEGSNRDPVAIRNIDISARGSNNSFEIRSLTMEAFGAQGSGELMVALEGEPRVELDLRLPQFAVEQVFAAFMSDRPAEGSMGLVATLSAQGADMAALSSSLSGRVSLEGRDLTLYGSDLDATFENYEDSQTFSLVDVGAFFFAGPAGVLVTKGYDFASILQSSDKQTPIRRVVSDWSIESGVATAQDVAMATARNRVALAGSLDFTQQAFVDVRIALLDADGCATVTQQVNGSFWEPEVERPGLLRSLAGPVIDLVGEVSDEINNSSCQVFYRGSLQGKALGQE